MGKISRLTAFFTLTLMFSVFNVSFAASTKDCGKGVCNGKKCKEKEKLIFIGKQKTCRCSYSPSCENKGETVSPDDGSSDEGDRADPGDRKIIIYRPR